MSLKLLKLYQVGHDVTNIGDDEMFVMLWANEIFDPENPDTIYHKV